jgi:hypothetical protein
MEHSDLYKLLGVDEQELQDFLRKYREFLKTLPEKQRHLLTRSTPTVAMAMKYFSPDVTEAELTDLFQEEGHRRVPPIICCVPGSGGHGPKT